MRTRLFFLALLCLLFSLSGSLSHAVGQMPYLEPLPGTGKLGTGGISDRFTFVVAGDNRPAKDTDPPTETTGQIFTAAGRLNPTFVFWTGDSIYGKAPNHEKRIGKQYEAFLKVAQQAGVPVFNAPGNHEMDNKDDVPNATMQKFYKKYMGRLYGAFDYGNSRFIAINTEMIAPKGTVKSARAVTESGKTLDPGYVNHKQLKLLDADLKANTDKAHIFVFMHHPIKPYKKSTGLDEASAKALVAIFSKYENVSYVLAGHEHMYFNPQGKQGTDPPPDRTDPAGVPPFYLVSGGAGAPFTKSMPPGSFHHYLVFTVSGDKVTVELIKLD